MMKSSGKAQNLNRVVFKWRRNRERSKRLKKSALNMPMPLERRESGPGVPEPTT